MTANFHVDNQNNKSNNMIRHEGCAHIRGKIRRVWRPRYLELTDNGLVRYYELYDFDSTLPQEEEADVHSKVPKSTLLIHHARIIDVTTFRDLHVGLPKGTFGFCFHGRRLERLVEDAGCHAPEPVAPRDFLCAVATLEQAQSWVVALQWAASIRNSSLHVNPFLSWDTVVEDHEDDEEDYYMATTMTTSRDRPRPRRKARNALELVSSIDSDLTLAYKEHAPKQDGPKMGKIVVTKVCRFRFVTCSSWYDVKVAYNVQLLLLRFGRAKNANQPLIVEERTVVRTKDDLMQLLHLLKRQDFKEDTAQETLRQAERLLLQLHQKKLTSRRQIQDSVTLVDAAMRALAMEGTICNSKPMRTFWCITQSRGLGGGALSRNVLSRLLAWPSVHDSFALWDKTALKPKTKNPDDLVKTWLQQTPKGGVMCSPPMWQWYLVWMLKHPFVLVGIVSVSWVLAYPLLELYQSVMISFQLRLDVLILSWLVSLGVGREWGKIEAAVARLEKMGTLHHKAAAAAPRVKTAPKRQEPARFEEEASLLDSLADSIVDCGHSTTTDEGEDYLEEETESCTSPLHDDEEPTATLSSPLPHHPANGGVSCWSKPHANIFRVRGVTYLQDRVKVPSAREPFVCRGVDVWLTDNPERHIARHPSVLGGKLHETNQDCFVVNFLLPFGNFVAYFDVPPLSEFPANLREVWTKFLMGDQQYRDARLKLLPVVVDGPWIVRKAVGPGTSPALLGKVIPLQYYFSNPTDTKKGVYEVDIIITASRIAKGILSVVKGHTNALTIAFAFIVEAAEEEELPETVLCTFQVHALQLERCPQLPECSLDELD